MSPIQAHDQTRLPEPAKNPSDCAGRNRRLRGLTDKAADAARGHRQAIQDQHRKYDNVARR
jgi:hypothetical protein